jgi:hypothetical protein
MMACRVFRGKLVGFWLAAAITPVVSGANLAGPGRAYARNDHFVSTTVFHWFGVNTGQLTGPWRPLEGRENWTGEPDFWQGQIKQMMSANIDMLYVHLFNDVHEQKRINLFNALGQMRAQGYDVPKVVPFLDPPLTWFSTKINVGTTAGKDEFAAQYIRFYNQYYSVNTDADADSYIGTLDGRPMLDTWHVFANLDNIGSLSRANVTTRLSAAFGAQHPLFNNNVYMITTALNPPTLGFADEKVPQFEVNEYYRATTASGITAAQLKGGYWDQNIRNPGSQLKRDGGVPYVNAWNTAVANRGTVRHANVESWNEYDEGSGIYAANPVPYIAPESGNVNTDTWSTTNDPWEYIKTIADGARRFNDLPDRDARILWHTFPSELKPGETRNVTVIVRNEGDLKWSALDQYKFGQQEFVPGEVLFGPARYLLDDTANEIPTYGGIFRGQPIVLQIPVTAPASTGSFQTHWAMLQENVAWFGQVVTQNITVTNNATAQVINVPFDLNLPNLQFMGSGVTVNVGSTDLGQTVPARLTVASITVDSAAAGNVLHSALPGNTITIGALNIAAASKLKRTGPGAVRVSSLNINPTGQLDLSNSSLIVDYSSASPLNSIRLLLNSGAAGGNWNGNGINSSAAAAVNANPSEPHKTALAYAEASALGINSFAGEAVDGTTVVIQYTYAGDANLDGRVDVADLGVLASHWQTAGVWTDGDFDYSGGVNVSDLGVLASNWQTGASGALGDALASVGLPSVAVPEPGSLLTGAVSFGLCSIRVRRQGEEGR